MEFVKTFSKAWKIPEIRSKIIFTLLMLLVFRIGSNIPVPGIDREYLAQMFSGETGLLDLFDLFSGGAFSNFTIFALSITPYITASIIVQLLTIAFPYFERLAKEGTEGRKKMATITRYIQKSDRRYERIQHHHDRCCSDSRNRIPDVARRADQ